MLYQEQEFLDSTFYDIWWDWHFLLKRRRKVALEVSTADKATNDDNMEVKEDSPGVNEDELEKVEETLRLILIPLLLTRFSDEIRNGKNVCKKTDVFI